MSTKRISFENRHGRELSGLLDLPDASDPHSYAIFAHCFICSASVEAIESISHALTTKGIAVLRFDFTGLDTGQIDNGEHHLSSNVFDLIDAGNYLADAFQAPSILIGHSLGGAAAIFAASQMKSVRAVASIASPASNEGLMPLLERTGTPGEDGESVEIGGTRFVVSDEFMEDLDTYDMRSILESLNIPLLLLHSPEDRIVDIKNAQKIYNWAHQPKSLIALSGATHLLTDEADANYAGQVIASWAARYLEIPRRETPETHHQVAVSLGNEGYTTEMVAGKHMLTADEPINLGGKDYGPSPYEYVSAGLGACTAMTLRMYADRKKWDLQKVVVHLDHRKDYPSDIDETEKGREKIDIIDRRIEIYGDLDDKQKARLIEIANKCPVHKTLRNVTTINTSLYN